MIAPTESPDTEQPGGAAPRRRDRLRPVLVPALLSIAGGALTYLAGPPRTLWWLAPLGLALLGWVLPGRRARAGFGYGFLFGLGFLVPLLAWTGVFVGAIAWLPLAAACAALLAVACAAISVVGKLPGWPLWAALLWVAGETFRSVFPFGGFPWPKLAFGQPDGIFLPLAALGGTPLIAFAVTLTGFGLAAFVRGLVDGDRAPVALVGRVVAVVLPVAAAFAAIPLVGTDAQAGTVTVAAVQGNVPRAGLDFNAQRRAVLDNHVRRTEQLAQDVKAGRVPKPDVVIWPENSSDIDPLRNPDAYAEIDQVAADLGAPIAVGAVLVGDDGKPRNTVLLWETGKGPVAQYTKRQLQPFGETMPMRGFFRLFTSEVDRAGNFVPGDKPVVFAMGPARVALDTCYEVAFDGVVRDSIPGSNLLAVPTNNATFGRTEMTYQQLAMDRVRAVEHGRAVVVAATSGVSALVRPDGSVIEQTDLFTPAALVERLPLRTATTLSDRLGATPEWVMDAAGLLALAAAVALGRRRSASRQNQSNTPR